MRLRDPVLWRSRVLRRVVRLALEDYRQAADWLMREGRHRARGARSLARACGQHHRRHVDEGDAWLAMATEAGVNARTMTLLTAARARAVKP